MDKKEIKSVRLPASLIKRINEMAKRENRNFTNMVEVLLIKSVQ